MNQTYNSVAHRGPIALASANANSVRLDPLRSPGRLNITITNTTDFDVYIRRVPDTGDTLGGRPYPTPVAFEVPRSEVGAPSSAAVITDFTYRIPPKSTLDDPCGDTVAYFGAMQTGSGNAIVQECY
jgi:hypothetical protein